MSVITLSDYEVIYPESSSGKDYDVVIKAVANTEEERKLLHGGNAHYAVIPYSFGVVDTTINSKDFICTLISSDNKGSRPHPMAFFTRKKKDNVDLNKGVSKATPSKAYQAA